MKKIWLQLTKNEYLNAIGEINSECVGSYYPAADYEALEAEVARLNDHTVDVYKEQRKAYLRLRKALERYVGKFGNCGDVYDEAKAALEASDG